MLTWAEQEGNVPRAQRATMVMKPNLLLALEIIKQVLVSNCGIEVAKMYQKSLQNVS